jgi:glucuronokinase
MRIVRSTAHARAALVGNPSDGYYGRTISLIVRNFAARAVLYEWPELEIILSQQDRCCYDRVSDLVQDVRLNSYYGGLRLVKGAIKRFAEYCEEQGIKLHDRNFALRYETDIPRQVGLAGSSAIITAVFRALMDFYEVQIPQEILPGLILSVETKEIGIAAGLQDRVTQVYEGLVYMDFDREYQDAHGHGIYQPLDSSLLPPLFLAYRAELSEVSGIYHSNLRARWETGDREVIEAMRHLAGLALEAKSCLLAGDFGKLGNLINENFDTRARISRLDPRHTAMIELARKVGAPAHYAGSGGSILGMYEDERMLARLRSEFEAIGCRLIVPKVSPEG